jgi:hypothetical protein
LQDEILALRINANPLAIAQAYENVAVKAFIFVMVFFLRYDVYGKGSALAAKAFL